MSHGYETKAAVQNVNNSPHSSFMQHTIFQNGPLELVWRVHSFVAEHFTLSSIGVVVLAHTHVQSAMFGGQFNQDIQWVQSRVLCLHAKDKASFSGYGSKHRHNWILWTPQWVTILKSVKTLVNIITFTEVSGVGL